jgi:hypothetical protein
MSQSNTVVFEVKPRMEALLYVAGIVVRTKTVLIPSYII